VSGKDGKTEKPTPKRLRDAQREGQTPKSREVGAATSLIGALFALQVFAPSAAESFAARARWLFLTGTGGDELPADALVASMWDMTTSVLVPFLLVAVAVGLAGGFLQVGFKPAPKAIKPQAKRLNPKRGAQKFKPSQMGWELARNLVKIGLLALLLWVPLQEWLNDVAGRMSLEAGVSELADTVLLLLGLAAVLALIVAAADFAWTKRNHIKQLMMRRDEVKREAKDQEGDPQLKQRRRQKAADLSRNRMIASAAEADAVVTNPTHFAVALRYEAGEPAPRIIAKAMDDAALELGKEARRHGVPVYENPPLARGLYRRCHIGDYVPEALFEAVAAVLAAAYRRTGKAVA